MNFIKTNEDKLAQEYSEELSDNKQICKDILKLTQNNTTEVVTDKDIKNSYYVFLNDKIYIADNQRNNKLYTRITHIAHECVHSNQLQFMQILNFAFANFEIIIFVILLITKILSIDINKIVTLSYITINIISLVIRLGLEIHAVVNSLDLSRKYLNLKISEDKANIILNSSKKYIIKYMPFFILSLCFWKVFRLIVIII